MISSGQRFEVENSRVRASVVLNSGSVTLGSFLDLRTGKEWPSSETARALVGLNSSSVDWRLASSSSQQETGQSPNFNVVLRSPELELALELNMEVRDEFPGIRFSGALVNEGHKAFRIEQLQFFNFSFELDEEYAVAWVSPFDWDNDLNGFRTHSATVSPSLDLRLFSGPYSSMDCRAFNLQLPLVTPPPTSERASPYAHYGALPYIKAPRHDFGVEREGPFTESCGWFVLESVKRKAGLFSAWEWSGSMESVFSCSDETLHVSLGHAPRLFAYDLKPGERLELPAVWLGAFDGDLDDAGHELRSLAETYYIRKLPDIRVLEGAEFPYVVGDTWGRRDEIDDQYIRKMIDQAADLGVEVFLLDKGWERSAGDWREDRQRFPSGLRAISDYAHQKGLGFGLYCGFGMAAPESAVAREHPDWLASWGGIKGGWTFGNHTLCFGHAPARRWAASELIRIVREYNVDWLLQDFEVVARCNCDRHTHQPEAGDHAAVLGLYEVLDELRAACPKLIIENCWSGGRMMDLAMMQRHDTSIGDDWCMAIPNRLAAYGSTRFLPPSWNTKYMRDENLAHDYLVRSYIFGGPWVIMADWVKWGSDKREAVCKGIALHKKLRPLINRSRIYHIEEPKLTGMGWDAIEAYDAPTGQGVIVAHRSYGHFPLIMRGKAKGLDPNGTYTVWFEGRDERLEMSGAMMMEEGIPMRGLSDHYTTEVVHFALKSENGNGRVSSRGSMTA